MSDLVEDSTEEEILNEAECEQMIRNGQALAEIWERYALLMSGAPPGTKWEAFARGITGRCCYTLRSILLIADREPDAASLTRSLYDHAVAFAWVAINPTDHVQRFQRSTLDALRVLHNDLVFVGAYMPAPNVGEAHLFFLEEDLKGIAPAPNPYNMTDAADRHWKGVLGDDPGFRRNYAAVFRHFSKYLHPSVPGILPFISPTPAGQFSRGMAAAMATLIFFYQLMIASKSLGWPTEKELADAFSAGFGDSHQ